MRPSVKPGGFNYYEYILFYVDEVLCISDDPLCTMKVIQSTLKPKGYKLKEPDMYLGANLSKMNNVNGQEYRAMSSGNFFTTAVTNVESAL